MKQCYLDDFIRALPSLPEVINDDISVSVIDIKTMDVLASHNGKSIKMPFTAGTKATVHEGVLDGIIKGKRQFVSTVPQAVYGVKAK